MNIDKAVEKIGKYGKKIYSLEESELESGLPGAAGKAVESLGRMRPEDPLLKGIKNTLNGINFVLSVIRPYSYVFKAAREASRVMEELCETSRYLKKIKEKTRGEEEEKAALLLGYFLGAVSFEDVAKRGDYDASDVAKLKNVALQFDIPGIEGRKDRHALQAVVPEGWIDEVRSFPEFSEQGIHRG